MSNVTEQILTKLQHIESISEPTLTVVLDFVSYLETRLESDTSTFVLGLAESDSLTAQDSKLFSDGGKSCFDLTAHLIGIGDELPEDLSTNPVHMAGYGL